MYLVFRDDEAVIGHSNNEYQIYSVLPRCRNNADILVQVISSQTIFWFDHNRGRKPFNFGMEFSLLFLLKDYLYHSEIWSSRTYGPKLILYINLYLSINIYLSLVVGLSVWFIIYFSSTGLIISNFKGMIKRMDLHPIISLYQRLKIKSRINV